MSFIENVENELNKSTTLNGMAGYKTTGKALLDLNFSLSSLRHADKDKIKKAFIEAFFENKELAMKELFYIRDIREGAGERRIFRTIIRECFRAIGQKTLSLMVSWIPEYGRYDDLFNMYGLDDELDKVIIDYCYVTMLDDVRNYKEKDYNNISLLAKWMPSYSKLTGHSTEEKIIEQVFLKDFLKTTKLSQKNYRKAMSKLRAALRIVEKDMSAKQWSNIDYNKVPSKAALIYRKAFAKHDKERYTKYLEDLSEGKAKVNASVTEPYEIVHRMNYGMEEANSENGNVLLEKAWESLPDLIGKDQDILVVLDTSGSMQAEIDFNSSIRCSDVANSIAVYAAEKLPGVLHNKVLAFSREPYFLNLPDGSLCDKLTYIESMYNIDDTNIEAVFQLLLDTMIKNEGEKMPNSILILSDMEFNECTENPNSSVLDSMREKYKEYGYKLPKLVFWNINWITNTIPILENENGICLVSGFSKNLFKQVISNELNPFKILLETLLSDRYKAITYYE